MNSYENLGHFGTVTSVRTNGYGFIRVRDVSNDLFFHATNLAIGESFDAIEVGAEVEFDVITDESRRPRAVNVRVV